MVLEGPGVSAGLPLEVLAASRSMQDVLEISDEEPPPPPLGSHNSELFPELDSQHIPVDMREQVSAVSEAGTVERERER